MAWAGAEDCRALGWAGGTKGRQVASEGVTGGPKRVVKKNKTCALPKASLGWTNYLHAQKWGDMDQPEECPRGEGGQQQQVIGLF